MSATKPGDIAKLAEMFAAGGWKDLRLQSGSLQVYLSADSNAPGLGGVSAAVATDTVVPLVSAPANIQEAPEVQGAPEVQASPDWAEVRAPNLGTFYRSPKPGAAPFVEIGQKVGQETEICLLEVMKLFTSVKAGVDGTIRKVCVEDGVLVESGQLLFLVEAD